MADRNTDRMHPETAGEWRAWLAEHGTSASGVWLVFWRKGSGRPVLSYDVDETAAGGGREACEPVDAAVTVPRVFSSTAITWFLGCE
jgi:hypothetical protein